MGIVTQTIGTSARNFSTIAAWEAALPASLVTDGNSYVGQCFNDSQFTITAEIAISGSTTDASHTITLTCGAGQSFSANANVQTNALRYNQSNGVGISKTNNDYAGAMLIADQFFTMIGIQILCTTINTGNGPIRTTIGAGSGAGLPDLSGCILQNHPASGTSGALKGVFGTVVNCLIIQYLAGTEAWVSYANDVNASRTANCTIVCPTGVTSTKSAIAATSASVFQTSSIINCANFGFTAFISSTATVTGSNNATDQASVGFGSSNQTSLTYASQFQDPSSGTPDFRAKTGGGLIDTGATDTTDIPGATDIAGTSRPNGSAWDIGCWELVGPAVQLGFRSDMGAMICA